MSLALISLSQTAPHCGLVVKEYDASARRKSADVTAFPPNLRLALKDHLADELKDLKEEEHEPDLEDENGNPKKNSDCCNIG